MTGGNALWLSTDNGYVPVNQIVQVRPRGTHDVALDLGGDILAAVRPIEGDTTDGLALRMVSALAYHQQQGTAGMLHYDEVTGEIDALPAESNYKT